MNAKLKISITKFEDIGQPGYLRVEFVDCHGKKHSIFDKVPLFVESTFEFDQYASFPQTGYVVCKVIKKFTHPSGRECATVEFMHGVETEDGESMVDVFWDQLCFN